MDLHDSMDEDDQPFKNFNQILDKTHNLNDSTIQTNTDIKNTLVQNATIDQSLADESQKFLDESLLKLN